MIHIFQPYLYPADQINQRVSSILSGLSESPEQVPCYRQLIGHIDLTSLEGSDTEHRIRMLCGKARNVRDDSRQIPAIPAVCVYSPFVALARKELSSTGIRVACAAGGFPSGQLPLKNKMEEIRFAIDQGAEEIDTVINRGKLLGGNGNEVYDELAAIRELCSGVRLKVILETGELGSVEKIREASEIAILAGADMIKTSTGKIQPAATEDAVLIMLDTIHEFAARTGKCIGIKPAGGIRYPLGALRYYHLVRHVLGEQWLTPHFFRIGASQLLDNLLGNL